MDQIPPVLFMFGIVIGGVVLVLLGVFLQGDLGEEEQQKHDPDPPPRSPPSSPPSTQDHC